MKKFKLIIALALAAIAAVPAFTGALRAQAAATNAEDRSQRTEVRGQAPASAALSSVALSSANHARPSNGTFYQLRCGLVGQVRDDEDWSANSLLKGTFRPVVITVYHPPFSKDPDFPRAKYGARASKENRFLTTDGKEYADTDEESPYDIIGAIQRPASWATLRNPPYVKQHRTPNTATLVPESDP